MYSFFNNLKNPILILGILVVSLLLILTISSGVSSIGSMLGFNTKENTAIKLENTTNELEKATELLEHNATEDKIVKEIDVITNEKIVKDATIIDSIKSEEVKVLEQIKNTEIVDDVVECKEVEDTTPTINKEPNLKVKPTIVYVKKKLNNKQKLGLSVLRDRANNLKGSKR